MEANTVAVYMYCTCSQEKPLLKYTEVTSGGAEATSQVCQSWTLKTVLHYIALSDRAPG